MIEITGQWIPWDKPPPAKPRYISGLGHLPCPVCEVQLIGMNRVNEIFICIACRALIALDVEWDIVCHATAGRATHVTNVFLRRPTDDEEEQALRDPRVIEAIKMVAEHHRVHGSPHPAITPPDTSVDTETDGTQVIRDHQGRVIQRGNTHHDDIGAVPPFPPPDPEAGDPPY